MIVVDASVLANIVADDVEEGNTSRMRLAAAGEAFAPDLADVETVAVLRRRWLHGGLTDTRFQEAIVDLLALPIMRVPVGPLMIRAYELRANATAYAACYIALAETLDCPLITAETRLATAPGTRCTIEVLTD